METKANSNAKRTAIKISLVAVISLLLLIPLAMIQGLIRDREETKTAVTMEVAKSYAIPQTVYAPYLVSYVAKEETVDKKNVESGGKQTYKSYNSYCSILDYAADIDTDILHRSIYDVIVYNSKVRISGKISVTEKSVASNGDLCTARRLGSILPAPLRRNVPYGKHEQ